MDVRINPTLPIDWGWDKTTEISSWVPGRDCVRHAFVEHRGGNKLNTSLCGLTMHAHSVTSVARYGPPDEHVFDSFLVPICYSCARLAGWVNWKSPA